MSIEKWFCFIFHKSSPFRVPLQFISETVKIFLDVNWDLSLISRFSSSRTFTCRIIDDEDDLLLLKNSGVQSPDLSKQKDNQRRIPLIRNSRDGVEKLRLEPVSQKREVHQKLFHHQSRLISFHEALYKEHEKPTSQIVLIWR